MRFPDSIAAIWILAVGLLGGAEARGGVGEGWASHAEYAAGLEHPLAETASRFLAAHAPERDRGIDAALLNENLEMALLARDEFAWGAEVPEGVFLNDVLPYASLDETRERWRPALYAISKQIVADAGSITEAAQLLNEHLFDAIGVHYHVERERANQSVFESMKQGRATCTGLSIVLVNACRSVGIPARIAGVARWKSTPGNHTWVEVWDGRGWSFTGADEHKPEGLNRAWFTGRVAEAVPGSADHGVWASSWRRTGQHFPMSWDRSSRSVPAVDVTRRYIAEEEDDAGTPAAGSVARFFRVWDRRGGERLAASITLVGEDGSRMARMMTRSGRADLNDMPSAVLASGARYGGFVRGPEVAAFVSLDISDARSGVIDIFLDEIALSEDRSRAVAAELLAARRASIRAERADEIASDSITIGGAELRYMRRDFDADRAGPRPLWISLHGGGGAPSEVNDRQWKNQIGLYAPSSGVYVAPRAPTDTWNMWHRAHIDPLLDRLIENMIAAERVDPDRVYLMGYSAGGDGVYQLAPRMADRFAAAAMMAGHPNEARPDGLRNLPFAIFMGAEDSAYGRNEAAERWASLLSGLRSRDPAGYQHKVAIYPELGHWMEGKEAEALPWMLERSRDPWPERVVWRQDDVVGSRFYWLSTAPGAARGGQWVTADVVGQSINITADAERSPAALVLRLSDSLVDLDRPVTVSVNGSVAFEGKVLRSRAAIEHDLGVRFDPGSVASGFVEVELR